jgi:hypothetical protein
VRRICSVTIDLDPLRCYYEIHALGEPPATLAQVVLRRALPRFADLFARRGLHATFFVVGADLDAGGDAKQALAAGAELRALAAAGHEIGNHSQSHRYDMARLGADEAFAEMEGAHRRIAEAVGRPPVGFRAPGYDVSAAMIAAAGRLGYCYDSSIFPAPLYWTAKAMVMGAMALAGRPSGAVLVDPRGLAAPLEPYRPDARAPWRRGQATLVELPISVTAGLRIPVIGTSLLLAPTAVRAHLLEGMRRRRFFNFELHGVDLIDADQDGIPAAVVAREPALRAPLVVKRRALEATLDRLAPDFRFVTLAEAAAEVQREGGVR